MPSEIKKRTDVIEQLKFWRTAVECLCGIAAIALATFVCFRFKVHLPTPSCTYFIIIVLLSLRANLVSSIIVSLFAVGCLDYYFLPPLFSLNLSDPRDIIAAATFITAAFVISSLVTRIRVLMAEKLQKSETYLSEAQHLSHTGSFGWNVATGEITWSAETFRIFQCEPTVKPTVEFVLGRVHPEDAAMVKETIERVSREEKDFDIQHRIVMPDSSVKWLHVVAKPTKTKMRVLEFVGAVMDITERKKAQETLHETRTVLEFMGAVMDITESKKTEETLRETRTVLEFAMKSGKIGDWDLDLVNDTSRRSLRHDQCFGYNAAIPETDWGVEVFAKHLHPEDRACVVGSLQNAVKNLADWNSEFRVIWPDETIHWLAARGSIYQTREGKATRMLGVVMDITEKKNAEEALRSSEQKLEEAQRIAHVGYWERDLNTDIITWSDETYRIFGMMPRESILHLSELPKRIHPEDREIMMRAVDKALRDERRYDVEYRVIRPNGEVRFVHSSGDVIKDESGQPRRMFGTVQDITDRKRAEEALSAAVIAERNRVAQELHDTLLQGFTGIGLRLDAITNSLPPTLASTKKQLEKILEQSDQYLTEARRSVWQLRSPCLESSSDFPEALKKASERAVQGTGIPLRFTSSGAAFKLAQDIEDNFLRISEEAVTNAVKHASPTEVEVMLEFMDKELRLRIRDNGRGFDLDGPDGKKAGHFGLVGIRERANSLRGNLSLNSQPGQGTEILVTVCLSPQSQQG